MLIIGQLWLSGLGCILALIYFSVTCYSNLISVRSSIYHLSLSNDSYQSQVCVWDLLVSLLGIWCYSHSKENSGKYGTKKTIVQSLHERLWECTISGELSLRVAGGCCLTFNLYFVADLLFWLSRSCHLVSSAEHILVWNMSTLQKRQLLPPSLSPNSFQTGWWDV